jgi:hypothetical protein
VLGLGDQKTKWASALIPHESTVSLMSCKGTCGFTSHGPRVCLKNGTRLINRRLSQDCAYVPIEMC